MLNYMTLVCDLKDSKNLKNREDVQYQLIEVLKNVNKQFSSIIVSPFIITLGDEWQGLMHFPTDYAKILDYFQKNLTPVDFYCGIGIGEITIHNFELTVNQLDGPSFHKARKALKLAKQNHYSLVIIQ